MRRLFVLLVVMACAPKPVTPVSPFASLDAPTGPMSGESHVSVDAAGVVHLTWLEQRADSMVALRYARRSGTAWSPPRDIRVGRDFFVNWADFPVALSSGTTLTAAWLQRSSAGKYSYDVWFAQSADSGTTWSAPRQLNADTTASEHGFLSMVAAGGGTTQVFWLDGRASGTRPDGTHGAMQLRTAVVAPDGTTGTESLVDERNCDCCQTAVAMSAGGPVLAYRDRSDDEIRDIVVRRRANGGWSAPVKVHDDRWHIEACPVNGPAIVAAGDTVAVAWFTGAQDTARVQVAFSTDGGASFHGATRVDDGAPAGRVGAVLDGHGGVLVSWLERLGGDSAEVRLRRIAADGQRSLAVRVAGSSGKRASGFPRLARRGDDVLVSYTQPGDTARVRVASARIFVP